MAVFSDARSDARVKLRIGTAAMAAGVDAALLIEGWDGAPAAVTQAHFMLPGTLAHVSGCACCLPRGPVAESLSRLFLQRVRGEVPFFAEIVAVPATAAGEAAIRAALRDDAVIRARFRLVEGT